MAIDEQSFDAGACLEPISQVLQSFSKNEL